LFVTHDLAEGYKISSKLAVFESGHIVQLDEKEKVISFPSNHMVARLVGFKNLMEGIVVESQGSTALISVPELGGPVRATVGNTQDLAPGKNVLVGIRPEYIHLRDQLGENTFLSTVDRVAEGVTANNYYFHVNTVGKTRHYIMAILSRPESAGISEGQSKHLYLPPEHVVIIPT
jgi:molybdate transport system ATP-binding protein